MRHQKAKNRKIGCKNNQMYLFLTGNSHFVECSFWFWVLINSFQTALDQRTTISSPPPTPAVSNSRAAGLSIFGFCIRVLSGYLFSTHPSGWLPQTDRALTLVGALCFCSCAENTDFYGSFQLKPRRVSRVRGFFFYWILHSRWKQLSFTQCKLSKGFFPAARITASLALAGSRFPNSYFPIRSMAS